MRELWVRKAGEQVGPVGHAIVHPVASVPPPGEREGRLMRGLEVFLASAAFGEVAIVLVVARLAQILIELS